jgi:hypothetical protein
MLQRGGDLGADALARGAFRDLEFVRLFQVDPEAGAGAEVPREAQRCCGGYRAFAGKDGGDAIGRHAQGDGVRGQAERCQEVVAQDVAWPNWLQALRAVSVDEVQTARIKVCARNQPSRWHCGASGLSPVLVIVIDVLTTILQTSTARRNRARQ